MKLSASLSGGESFTIITCITVKIIEEIILDNNINFGFIKRNVGIFAEFSNHLHNTYYAYAITLPHTRAPQYTELSLCNHPVNMYYIQK